MAQHQHRSASAVERVTAQAWAWRDAGNAWHPRAAWHLLDWLGNAACGALSAQGLAMARWLQLQSPGPAPTLAGRASDAAAAAAYHGALGSALEMDDVHRGSILHPGPVVIPAALAACSRSTTGAELLAALIAGYEATIRIGRALGPSHYKLWHSTATAGVFGAAAAAAAVLRLSRAEAAQALAIAGTRSGGLWQVRHESQLGKAWHMAGAAREGFSAAQLAACGLTGPLGVIDGPSGWFAATAPEAQPDAIDDPQPMPWIADVSFKPWPACRHAHPAMDALREALTSSPIDVQRLERIDVFAYADAIRFCERRHPENPQQARFSIAHALAAWLRWGEPQLAHYEPEAIADSRVAALRERVFLHQDPAIDARYPASYGVRLVLQLAGGEQRTIELTDTYGDPARPMSDEALIAKARMLMRAARWSETRVDDTIAACLALPESPTLGALWQVIEAPR